jgi:hypothetical protein
LKRQADNDRQCAGGRQQAFYRQIENIGNDREDRRQINEGGQQVLHQFRFARFLSEHDERAQETDRQPRRGQPPDDFESAHEQASGLGPGPWAEPIGDDTACQQQTG